MIRGTTSRLMRYGGGTGLETVQPEFRGTITNASTNIETKYPKLVEARIQGSQPHKSSRDPSDPKEVITVSYHTDSGARALSIHAHSDGTWIEYLSRTGRKILGLDKK